MKMIVILLPASESTSALVPALVES